MPRYSDPVPVEPSTSTTQPHTDDTLDVFITVRPRLLAIARRVLGTGSDAEDIVQAAWVRWQLCDRGAVTNPTAFLVTATTRLAINSTRSAHRRREISAERWPGEAIPDAGEDPTESAERSEALEVGLRLLLERLSPKERAAYVLRHAFDYPYSSIAHLLHLTEDNARQLVSRARRHLAIDHRRPAAPGDYERFSAGFRAAARSGELAHLEAVLVADVASCTGRAPRTGRSHRPPRYVPMHVSGHSKAAPAVSTPATTDLTAPAMGGRP